MFILNQDAKLSDLYILRHTAANIIFKKSFKLFLAASKLLFGRNRNLDSPIMLMIEPSSRCNMTCPMCPTTTMQNSDTGEMRFEDYKEIIDEVGDRIFFLCLWLWGEPLLNPDLAQMISYAKQKNIFVALSTNGLSLTGNLIDDFVCSGLDYLIISFDGMTKESYERVRGVGNFAKVSNNIKEFIKKRGRFRAPIVELRVIVTKYNEGELSEINIKSALGADKVIFKKLSAELTHEAKDLLPVNQNYLPGIRGSNGKKRHCIKNLISSVIAWNGDVLPCCGDFRRENIMGNVWQEKSFFKIWNNRNYNDFRCAILNKKKINATCKHCLDNELSLKRIIGITDV